MSDPCMHFLYDVVYQQHIKIMQFRLAIKCKEKFKIIGVCYTYWVIKENLLFHNFL